MRCAFRMIDLRTPALVRLLWLRSVGSKKPAAANVTLRRTEGERCSGHVVALLLDEIHADDSFVDVPGGRDA